MGVDLYGDVGVFVCDLVWGVWVGWYDLGVGVGLIGLYFG